MGGPFGDYGSHVCILAAAVSRTTGPVLELGCGDASTPLLRYLCWNRRLVSADSDAEWLAKYSGYAGPNGAGSHVFVHVGGEHWLDQDWDSMRGADSVGWGCVFIDCAPGEVRGELCERFRRSARFIVAHDSEKDYAAGGNYGYEHVIKNFKFSSEFRRWRPYTLVLSDYEPFEIAECDRIWTPPA